MGKRQSSLPGLPLPCDPILVVGDTMCDHYIWGDVERISPEAPVQVLRWAREADRPGGAANAAMNLAALGCEVHIVGLVGNDDSGRWLRRALQAAGVNVSGLIVSRTRTTTVKTRIIARGQHLLRIDREVRQPASADEERRMTAAIKRLTQLSAVMCSDYGKGALTRRVLATIVSRRPRRFTLVDPKGRDFSRYRGADVLTPNEKELMEAVGDGDSRIGEDDIVRRRAETLMRRLPLNALLVTRGASGMDLFERQGRKMRQTHIAALQRHEVFDVTGAGDTVGAVLTLAAASGCTLTDAARFANTAAGIVVGMVGTAVADAETLSRMLDGQASQARAKVLSRALAAPRVAEAQARGETVVFTSGAFAAFDASQLRRLQQARAQGDLLVVGITGAADERAEMLAALRVVDYVVPFTESTPDELIRRLRPDIVIAPVGRAAAP